MKVKMIGIINTLNSLIMGLQPEFLFEYMVDEKGQGLYRHLSR
jgi:hypothetical protein